MDAPSLRNIALVAHVDHGKTTLVDTILRQTGTFAAHKAVVDRVMDSNDQERERGITILAKSASVHWKGVKINIVDTPGHADFGGEVERALAMVDGILLLVDAAEGPLPQTRYVLSKAIAADLPAIVVLNKVDRQVALLHATEGNPIVRKPAQVLCYEGIERVEAKDLVAGDVFVLAGFPEVEIGDTLADPADPDPLPRLTVDEPVLSMTFGVNTSPLAGKSSSSKFLTARHLRDRLNREVLGNVSIRIEDTESPEILQVAGRGELQLAVLIESMRREGFELQVSRPEVITREIDGKRHEPVEEGVIDVPDDYVGTITQLLAPRKGTVLDLRPGDPGRTIIRFEAPARGLLGLRGQMLTNTRGTAMMHTRHRGWAPWYGELPHRIGGAMIADRSGTSTAYALDNLQLRGELFIGPGEAVYEGMVVGESAKEGDMVVNVVREKQKTNIRTHAADDAIKLSPPRVFTIETAIEHIAEDELVEITPDAIRVRKRLLAEPDRRRASKRTD